ncbi:NAD(P)/FAD-dependent oxidoreductase [Fundidesulfovibrio butyratiphilus]
MAQNKTIVPRVVVVGAGFGGLWTARRLAGENAEVVVVDKRNYHTFLPLLYQVAAAELEPGEIAHPVRGVFRRYGNVRFALAEARRIDPACRVLHTSGPSIPYDYLVLCLGSETNFFGVPGAAEHCFGLKNLEEGIGLRNHILCLFERANLSDDPVARRRMLTFTVVGAGPTGVEYAGALAELIRGPLARDYPRLDLSQARVVLVEAGQAVLAAFPSTLRAYALEKLGRKGVEVRLGAQVERVDSALLAFKDGSSLATETVVWAAGVRGPGAASALGLKPGPAGRVPVDRNLRVVGLDRVFAVGDMAAFPGPSGPLPMLAPVAMQQGRAAAESILRLEAGRPLKPFRYRDKGSMATIGRAAAVATFGPRLCLTGFSAWLSWLFVHLVMLIGFRNRLAVLLDWAWDYFFFEKAVRLIMPAPAGPKTECQAGVAADSAEKPKPS